MESKLVTAKAWPSDAVLFQKQRATVTELHLSSCGILYDIQIWDAEFNDMTKITTYDWEIEKDEAYSHES